MKKLLTDPEGMISRAEFLRGLMVVVLLIVICAGIYAASLYATASMPVHTTGMLPFLGVVLFFIVISTFYFGWCIFAKRLRQRGYGVVWPTLCLLAAFGSVSARFATRQIVGTGGEVVSGSFAVSTLQTATPLLLAAHFIILVWMLYIALTGEEETPN